MPEERTGVQPGVSLVGLTEASDGRRREITTRLPSTIYLLNSALPCTSNLLVKFPQCSAVCCCFVFCLVCVCVCVCTCACVRACVWVHALFCHPSTHSKVLFVCISICHHQTDQHWNCAIIKQTSTGTVPSSNRPTLELCHQTDQHWNCAIKQTSTGTVPSSNRPAQELFQIKGHTGEISIKNKKMNGVKHILWAFRSEYKPSWTELTSVCHTSCQNKHHCTVLSGVFIEKTTQRVLKTALYWYF